MTVNRHTKALGAFAVGITILAAAPAEAASFRLRNCTNQEILVCSYAEHNTKMKIAASAKSLNPGERRRFHCSGREKKGKRCKAFIGITAKGGKMRVLRHIAPGMAATGAGAGAGAGATYAVAASQVTFAVGAEPGAAMTVGLTSVAAEGGTAATATAAAAGAAVGAAVVGAGLVIYRIAHGLHKNNLCRHIRDATLVKGDKRLSVPRIEHKYNRFDITVSGGRSTLTVASGDRCAYE